MSVCSACRYLPDRWTEREFRFRAAHRRREGDQEIHPPCQEDGVHRGARLHHGGLLGWQGGGLRGAAFRRMHRLHAAVPGVRDEQVLIGKCTNSIHLELTDWYLSCNNRCACPCLGWTGNICYAALTCAVIHFPWQHLDITFRRDPTNYRPRINKLDSTKDREQKLAGSYYYLDDWCGAGRGEIWVVISCSLIWLNMMDAS